VMEGRANFIAAAMAVFPEPDAPVMTTNPIKFPLPCTSHLSHSRVD